MKKAKRLLAIFITFIAGILSTAFADDWHIDINVSGGGLNDKVIIGAKKDALDIFDNPYDRVLFSENGNSYSTCDTPDTPPCIINIYSYHQEWSLAENIPSNKLIRDIRSLALPQEWYIDVYSDKPSGTPMTLSWFNLNEPFPSYLNIGILTPSGEWLDMKIVKKFDYSNIYKGVAHFKIVVSDINTTSKEPAIPQLIPYLPDPGNIATPILDWHDAANAGSYQIQVADNASFNNTPLIDTYLTESQYVVTTALPEGTIYWRVRAIGANNITSLFSSVDTFVIDTTPPVIYIYPVKGETVGKAVTISGTIETGHTIQASVDTGASIGIPRYPTDSTWDVDITNLSIGPNNITITATDLAGNSSSSSVMIRVLEDTDSDGLSDSEERILGTDPLLADTDGDAVSDGYEVSNYMNPLNPSDNRPSADAGESIITGPAIVVLDASRSIDPNNDILTFLWRQISGPSVVAISNVNDIQAHVELTVAGRYEFELIVNDGKINSLPDRVTVTVKDVPPYADAGMPQTVNAGTMVILDGSGSGDANGDPITYRWMSLTPDLVLTGANTARPSFTTYESGVHYFVLITSDGTNESPAVYTSVTIIGPNNTPPTADAGDDQIVNIGNTVVLDGRRSIDADNRPLPLTYIWIFYPDFKLGQSYSDVQLKDPDTVTPSFRPTKPGIYKFYLLVYDGDDYSNRDDVNIIINDPPNSIIAPIADAGNDQTVMVGDVVVLGGGKSYDPDNGPKPLTYNWTQTEGNIVTLSDPSSMTPTFTPTRNHIGVVKFSLVVYDGINYSLPDEVSVTINGKDNSIPIANAGEDQRRSVNEKVVLDGSKSLDPDGDNITYLWSQTKGPHVKINNKDSSSPTFIANASGIYTFMLVVDDGKAKSTPDEVSVTVGIPIADAGQDQIVKVGDVVRLDGSKSVDIDGTTERLTYIWKLAKGPDIELDLSDPVKPRFTPKKRQMYVLKLVVDNGYAVSLPSFVHIYVAEDISIKGRVLADIGSVIKIKDGDALDNAELIIPPGVLRGDREIAMGKVIIDIVDSKIRGTGIALNLEPDGEEFNGKVIVKIPFTIEHLQKLDSDIDYNKLKVFTYNEETKEWTDDGIDILEIDKANSYIKCAIRHFSMYQIGVYNQDIAEGGDKNISAAPPTLLEDNTINKIVRLAEDKSGGMCYIETLNETTYINNILILYSTILVLTISIIYVIYYIMFYVIEKARIKDK